MIRKIPAIAAVCMLFGALFSADRIAIAEPAAKGGVTPQEIETFWGMLESSVDGGYELVSRSALKQMLAEIGFTDNSGLAELNAKQKAKLGEIRTVKYILVSTIGKFGRRLNLSLSLIDASTGDVLPDRKVTDTVGTFEELADRLPGLLREIGLGTEAKKRGIYAMLHPVITAKNPPDYLSASFSSGLESFLLGKGMRLQNLKTVDPILRKNGIGSLDAAEPALFARIGELLRVDSLIRPEITRFSVTVKREYIAASKRTVERRICNLDGEIRILSTGTGEVVAVIPFRQKIDFDDVEAKEDTDDWTAEDYGKYAVEQLIPAIGENVFRAIGR